MKKIGLTGAIGSGKSTVCNIFRLLGIPVYDADAASKRLLMEDPDIRAGIRKQFGDNVLTNGLPDTAKLAAIVFNSPETLGRLNALMHPAVAADFAHWLESHQQSPYVIKEAAILFEAEANLGLDSVIAVSAPEQLRKSRTRNRYPDDPSQFEKRQAMQWPPEKKEARADFIIRNDESQLLIPQVIKIHERLSG